jgi:hypothetical protein
MPEVGLFGKFTKMSGQKGNRRGHSFNLPISFVLNRRMQIIVEKDSFFYCSIGQLLGIGALGKNR